MSGQLFVQRRVAQPHGRVRIVRAERQVLGHALDEPQRQIQVRAEDVVLKRVHQLVAEHVIGFRGPAADRHHDAALQRLR